MADPISGKNLLSADVEIKGSIKFQNELVIDGKIEGEIISNGILTVGENAEIRGEIKTKSVTVLGKVHGNITVEERCELKGRAVLQGDLKAARLVIEDGGDQSVAADGGIGTDIGGSLTGAHARQRKWNHVALGIDKINGEIA